MLPGSGVQKGAVRQPAAQQDAKQLAGRSIKEGVRLCGEVCCSETGQRKEAAEQWRSTAVHMAAAGAQRARKA